MHKLLFAISLISIFTINLNAQSRGFCGSNHEDNTIIRQRMFDNRDNQSLLLPRTGAIKYVPVIYFLTANSSGTGRIRYIKVLENICDLNRIYADQEIQFYLKNIIDVNNTFLYDDPSSTLGAAALSNLHKLHKNSINLFVASKANGTNLGVLAYYNPSGDYLVSEGAQVTGKGYTLAHEFGHFFSLAHTFYGWETTTYDCSQACPTEVSVGSIRVQVEYVDRELLVNGKKHCLLSADGFCDTQADYNCGFGWNNGCVWKGCYVDPEGKGLDPDEKNIMSYFLNNCHEYFSAEQKEAITRDYASSARAHLRTPAHTPLAMPASAPSNAQAIVNGFNSVQFKWDAVPNATHYILEYAPVSLSNNTAFKNHILTKTDTTITTLAKGQKVQWRVTAYNPTFPCPLSIAPQTFTNSNFGVAVSDLDNQLSNANVLYQGENKFNLQVESNFSADIKLNIFSLDGKLVSTENINIQTGINSIEKTLPSSGLFLYQLQNKFTSISGKIFAY